MIYIVRHGQTDWNVLGKNMGHKDIDINEVGIKQAEEIKEKLKDIEFDVVISSPLKRAMHTARIICGDREIISDERIMERCNGDLEGRMHNEVEKMIDFNDLEECRYNVETLPHFRERIKNFYDEVLERYKGKNVLIVTHAGVGIYTRCFFEGEPDDGDYLMYKMQNCEVLKYEN